MKNICFLFGAGAEGKGNYGLVNGYDYLKKTLFLNSINDIHANLFQFLKGKSYFTKKDKKSYKYNDSIFRVTVKVMEKFLYVYLENNSNVFNESEKNEIADVFSEDFIKKINKEFKLNIIKKGNDIVKKKILEDLKKVLTNSDLKYSEIQSLILKKIFFDDNEKMKEDIAISMANVLDSYFHTIIDPVKYGKNNFSKIFNYYWSCYFCIVQSIISNACIKDKELLYDYIKEGELDCIKVLLNIEDFTNKLYSFTNETDTMSYYKLLKHELDESNKNGNEINFNVITTNYFNFVEILDKNPAYLNGNLRTFELPELLEVVSLDTCDKELNWEKNIFFPFIFGQSLLKPIVHPFQIKQFFKAIDKLDNSDYLVIIGYKINEDDNHVNALLHDSLLKTKYKKIIIVTDLIKSEIINNLRLPSETLIELINFRQYKNEEIVNQIFNLILSE